MQRASVVAALVLAVGCGVPVSEEQPVKPGTHSRHFELTDEAGVAHKATILVPSGFESRVELTLQGLTLMVDENASRAPYEERLAFAQEAIAASYKKDPSTYLVAIVFEENNMRYRASLGRHVPATGRVPYWANISMATVNTNDVDDSDVHFCNGATTSGQKTTGSSTVTATFMKNAGAVNGSQLISSTNPTWAWGPDYGGWNNYFMRQEHTGSSGLMLLSGTLGCFG